jgi:HD-like signal output (HDOD) protein/ActR/RegA family two-component response regulator
MAMPELRALVVDDEKQIQSLVVGALRQQGFRCDVADDGQKAEHLIITERHDLVITDLKMPNMNGHALVLKLLALAPRPLIMVHTGVLEPKLANDLLKRGADDILFKPVDFSLLAAKARALVDRRDAHEGAAAKTAIARGNDVPMKGPPEISDERRVSLPQLNRKLAEINDLLPMSNAAIEVFGMAQDGDWNAAELAAAVQRDAALAAHVLRLANSALYNPSRQRIGRLEEAVLRIGHKRIGELALANSALAALTPGELPWVNVELTWKRSMAAGIVLEMLVDMGGHQEIEEGLLLGAIMRPLGRILLGMLFPKQYERMVRNCERDAESLRAQERCTFPTSHTEVLAYLLESWSIPREVYLPLKLSSDDFSSLSHLSEPLRTRVELVKLATSLARLIVGSWQSWDMIQLPSNGLLKRLGVHDVTELIHQARADLTKLADFRPSGCAPTARPVLTPPLAKVGMWDLAQENQGMFDELLLTLGFQPFCCSPNELRLQNTPVVVNCLDIPATQFAPTRGSDAILIVSSTDNQESYSKFGSTVALPNSYARFKAAIARSLDRALEPVGILEGEP